MRPAAVTRVNVMENTEGEVHYTFADNFAPYFLLVFSPIVVIFCLFGIFHTYLTTEVSNLRFFSAGGRNFELKMHYYYPLSQFSMFMYVHTDTWRKFIASFDTLHEILSYPPENRYLKQLVNYFGMSTTFRWEKNIYLSLNYSTRLQLNDA